MKKALYYLLLLPLLLKPVCSQAQFGQDAAALIGFLGPYLGALESISSTTGLEIGDLKTITQQSIEITSSLARVYNAGSRLTRVSERVISIYTEYLETVEYIYNNSVYFDGTTTNYHVAVLTKTVFGQTDTSGKLSVDKIMDGAMGDLQTLLTGMEHGAQTTLTEMATYLDGIRLQMDKTLSSVRSYKSYLRCSVSRKQHQLGMYELDEYMRNKNK